MTEQEKEDSKVRADMQRLGKFVDAQLPFGWGFIVMVFPFGSDGRINYISNADRADVVRVLYEFIETTKNRWAEHEPPMGAAAEDEQLGRARQRIAELTEDLRKANMQIEWLNDDLNKALEIHKGAFVRGADFASNYLGEAIPLHLIEQAYAEWLAGLEEE
jgi:hypothetical protein